VVRYRIDEAYLLRIRLDSLDHSHERCHHTLDRVALTTRRRNSRGRLGHQHESFERLHENAAHDADARRSWPELLASGRIAEGAAGGNALRRLARYRSDWRSHTRNRLLRRAGQCNATRMHRTRRRWRTGPQVHERSGVNALASAPRRTSTR